MMHRVDDLGHLAGDLRARAGDPEHQTEVPSWTLPFGAGWAIKRLQAPDGELPGAGLPVAQVQAQTLRLMDNLAAPIVTGRPTRR
jgi:hypothetical protein